MLKRALYIIIALLSCAVSMAWEAKPSDSNIVLPNSVISELSDADLTAAQTNFRTQNVCEYSPEDYFKYCSRQRPDRSRVIPATEDYDVRYSSDYCRPYWGE
ncbi:MAG: hypothetical protein IKS45_09790, partial [Thermoguttaceae bacterium]|nr:hypothetical protein [Thermoguttaceae bacterium]